MYLAACVIPAVSLFGVAATTAMVSGYYREWVFSPGLQAGTRPTTDEADYYAIQSVTTVGYGCTLSLPEKPDDLRGVAKARRESVHETMIHRFRRLSAIAMLLGAAGWGLTIGLFVQAAVTAREGAIRPELNRAWWVCPRLDGDHE